LLKHPVFPKREGEEEEEEEEEEEDANVSCDEGLLLVVLRKREREPSWDVRGVWGLYFSTCALLRYGMHRDDFQGKKRNSRFA
jgi:hypothetical protein